MVFNAVKNMALGPFLKSYYNALIPSFIYLLFREI